MRSDPSGASRRPVPRGYRGIGHETIGSDIRSVLDVVQFPKQVLGEGLADRLQSVKMEEWYPISWMLEPLEVLADRLGTAGLRRVGRRLFQLSHQEQFRKVARSAADLFFGMDAMYHRANRGTDIGGWKVLTFTPGKAELDKTTPHHCAMEEGILAQALTALGIPALVFQSSCLRQRADACVFVVTSTETGELWAGGRPYSA